MTRNGFIRLAAGATLASCTDRSRAVHLDRIGIALEGDPTTLNLLLGDDPNTFDIGMIINSFLLRTNVVGALIPDLALQVPSLANGGISRDGRTIRYELRSNAFWHDGRPVTADDVAFTLALINRPDVNVADRSGYDCIESVRVLTPHQSLAVLRPRLTSADSMRHC